MNNITQQFPCLVIEVRRYDKPEPTFRFFELDPLMEGQMVDKRHYFPFGRDGKVYYEADRRQINEPTAGHFRDHLSSNGYWQLPVADIPKEWRRPMVMPHLPIEFHQQFAQMDPVVIDRITVWVDGEFPVPS